MRFNKDSREKLRLKVHIKVEELKDAIDNKDEFKRLHIDKEWLEPLLFDEHIDEEGFHYKTIGYTYGDLYYIDLGDVNFENVSLDYKKYGSEDFYLDFEDTNIKIDFLKTYEARRFQQIVLSNVSFYGVDLSNNTIDETGVDPFERATVVNCNLSHTGLKITTSNVHFRDSKLYCVDLSKLNLYPDEAELAFTNCDLRDTFLNIKIDDRVNPDSIRRIINSPAFEGCKIGKTTIIPREKRTENAEKILSEYEAWRDTSIDELLDSLEAQVRVKTKTLKNESDNGSKNIYDNELPFEI